jgi:uncharacterized membrane protein
MTDQLLLLAVLATCALAGDWLGRRPVGRWFGGAILTLFLTMLLANVGVIPTAAQAPPLYVLLASFAAPAAIFLLLLDVNLGVLQRMGRSMFLAFAIGSVGTLLGVTVAFWVTGPTEWLGTFAAPVAGMYAATYIGGSANLNAVALHYGFDDHPTLLASVNAVDAVVGALWLIALVLLARLLHRFWGSRPGPAAAETDERQPIRPFTVAGFSALLALAFGGLWVSERFSALLAQAGFPVPSILILTTLALALALVPAVQRLGGARALGICGIYLFIGVVGASCDFAALAGLGQVGVSLLLFVTIAVLVHGLVQFGVGRLLGLSPEMLAVASSANIGGAGTILPIARGLDRMDLLAPGMIAGMLGNATGTYAGFLVVWFLRHTTG